MALPDFFFERVTDDVRQQMDGVLALVQRLNRQPLSADAEACLAGVAEAALSVRRVLESSRELQTVGSDLDLRPAPHRLRDLMDHVQERWQARARDNGVVLLVSYDGDPHAMAQVDGQRLVQVFDGFIAQAVAGARRGGVEASLRVIANGETMRLEGRVRDGGDRFGAGTEPYDLREIEARFGLETALGVALGQRIVEAMGGAVRHEPNRGLGETVVFDFAAPAAYEPEEAAPNAGTTRAAHILIVDDNATNRMVAETLCEMFECTSETAADGVEAVDAARSGRFDLILMDIKMPRMDGVAASKAIRNLAGRPGRVPIIALTANADPEDVAAYLAAGMNGVVEKPMKPEHLLQALQSALGDGPAAAA